MIKEILPCQLTKSEIEERAFRVVALMGEHDEIEMKAKEEAAQHKAALKDLRSLTQRLGEQVRSGVEKRLVEVVEEQDLLSREVRTVRVDTGEVVRSRAMTHTELEKARQPELFLEEAEAEDARH